MPKSLQKNKITHNVRMDGIGYLKMPAKNKFTSPAVLSMYIYSHNLQPIKEHDIDQLLSDEP